MKLKNKSQEKHQNLMEVEEKELTQWITLCIIISCAPISDVVCEMTEGIKKRRIKGVNEVGMELVYYKPIEKE